MPSGVKLTTTFIILSPHSIAMSRDIDRFDKLVSGKQFDKRTAGTMIDGGWVSASVTFDTDKLQYRVNLHWWGDEATKYYSDEEDAVGKFEILKARHGLE